MRVRCSENSGKALSPQYLEMGYTRESVCHVAIGKEYLVFAVAVYRGAVLVLLSDEDDLPDWYPLELFSISEARVPQDWLTALYRGNEYGLQFLLGYERIVSDESHYDALLERVPAALEAFRLQKKKYEEWESGGVQ